MRPRNEKEEMENMNQETEAVLKKIQEQLKLSEDALKSVPYRRSMTVSNVPILNENQNIVKIQDSKLEFVNIEDDYNKKPKDAPFDEVCSICSSKIYYEKYLCLVCKECILCSSCELMHLHPVIKWKNNQLNNLNKIFLFMSNYNEQIKEINNKNKSSFFGSNRTKYSFKLLSDVNEYTMQPNQKLEIPISIINLNNNDIDCNKINLILFGSNIKDLIVYSKEIKSKIKKEENFKTIIDIQSGNFCKIYNFEIGLFSSSDIDLDYNTISFKVKVTN